MKVTIHREPKPKTWILIRQHTIDDAMVVVCHWHHKPSLNEVNEMRKTVAISPDAVFFVVKSSKGDIHCVNKVEA